MIPIGTQTPSVGVYIAECQRVLESMKEEGIRYEVCALSELLTPASVRVVTYLWLWNEFGGPDLTRVHCS